MDEVASKFISLEWGVLPVIGVLIIGACTAGGFAYKIYDGEKEFTPLVGFLSVIAGLAVVMAVFQYPLAKNACEDYWVGGDRITFAKQNCVTIVDCQGGALNGGGSCA